MSQQSTPTSTTWFQQQSILSPNGSYPGSCGYCTEPGSGLRSASKSSWKTGADAVRLSPAVYQAMIDRGWRRSGTYCYKPNLPASCCPQYTIRLDATSFTPTRRHRKLINRWNRYITFGDDIENSEAMDTDDQGKHKPANAIASGRKQGGFTIPFPDILHVTETSYDDGFKGVHKFEVTLEVASYTDEKYRLFQLYQSEVHNDPSTPGGFRRFLVDSPIYNVPIEYETEPHPSLPRSYGSYHQLYRLDGELIAIGVLDILPSCVSSVYFMYNRRWEWFSLGKLSAIREAALALEMSRAGVPDLHWVYMGFYIHSCQKMRYKGEYSPSYLLDTADLAWYPLPDCIKLLDKYRYACFSNANLSCNELVQCGVAEADPDLEGDDMLNNIQIIKRVSRQLEISALKTSRFWKDSYARQDILDLILALGSGLSRQILILCQ